MARNHAGQMALYEALNKERFRTAQKKELSRITQRKPEKAFPVQPVSIPPQQPKNADTKQTVWTKKTSMFGLNNGRVEAYVPYPIAVTIVMALTLLLIILFQIGNAVGKRNNGNVVASRNVEKSSEATLDLAYTAKAAKELARSAAQPGKHVKAVQGLTPAATTTTVETEQVEEPAVKASEAKTGEYSIVLAELKNTSSARDLEPAKQYFDEHGIATEIKNVRSSYFLVTTEKYDGNFNKGAAGYAAVEKIRQIGAKYKAPSGYGGFGAKPFSDAYGRKL